ncbi:MAG: tRNA-dihydrouridine synthase [Helicobacter sp.]|nr:tRNA-dihydrouridine synthase [Helicobacter sp.]
MSLDFNNLLMLAPMAGFSDLPFRAVVKDFGADVTVSEMISSHALIYQNEKTLKMLSKSDNETPYSVQISGSKDDVLIKAVELINEMEGVDIIDFNCGCPAPKVTKNGNGSALLSDLPRLVSILQLIRDKSTKKHVSVKVRLGFDKKIPEDIAHALNDAPVSFVVVHARTKTDGYKKEKIDYEAIAKMKVISKHPIIANGEIDSFQKAHEIKQKTGANGLMIGRAAIGAPWIFWQIKNNKQEAPNLIKREIILRHFDLMSAHYGARGAIMFRKNLHSYAKGSSGASAYRQLVNETSDLAQMRDQIEEFFTNV